MVFRCSRQIRGSLGCSAERVCQCAGLRYLVIAYEASGHEELDYALGFFVSFLSLAFDA
jgi:hypothetical protein